MHKQCLGHIRHILYVTLVLNERGTSQVLPEVRHKRAPRPCYLLTAWWGNGCESDSRANPRCCDLQVNLCLAAWGECRSEEWDLLT